MRRAPSSALRALPLLGAAVSLCAGLKCVCQLCEHTNFTCQTEGACWASVMLTNGKEEVVKSCVSLPELNAQVFCHSSKNITKTECCYTDFCNNITLRLPIVHRCLAVVCMLKMFLPQGLQTPQDSARACRR